jgi:hypothetical protein
MISFISKQKDIILHVLGLGLNYLATEGIILLAGLTKGYKFQWNGHITDRI